jgi:leucyl aminopeptidase (aminopeptidase T)
VHIAFGGHGKIKCGVHEDIILLKPTVTIDGKKIAENGELLI